MEELTNDLTLVLLGKSDGADLNQGCGLLFFTNHGLSQAHLSRLEL